MADDANKDEVEKCKRIAENAMAAGDADKATRFLQKAKRMSPGDASIDALLAKAASNSGGGGASPTAGTSSGGEEGPRFRATASASSSASAGASSAGAGGATRTGKDGRTYTAEQMQTVQRILRTKDYYDILEVPKNSDEKTVSKAYKKLALKLHPDKNKAPGAEEAFKKLSKAVQCLTDAEKRRAYDRYGDEENLPQQQRHYQQQDFVSPEDIFAAFFGGGFPQAGGAQYHQHRQDDHEGQRMGLMQIIPVLILVLMTAGGNLTSVGNAGSKFNMSPTSHYRNERNTPSLDVPYYVTDDFHDYYPEGTRTLADFERQVEVHYVRTLHSECDYQEKTLYKKITIARRRGNEEEIAAAKKHPKPACKEIDKIKRTHKDIFRVAMFGHF